MAEKGKTPYSLIANPGYSCKVPSTLAKRLCQYDWTHTCLRPPLMDKLTPSTPNDAPGFLLSLHLLAKQFRARTPLSKDISLR